MRTHVLVIGGTRGLGHSLAKTFSKEGLAVSVIGRRAPANPDKNCSYWLADLADPAGLHDCLAEVAQKNGKLQHLVFFQRFRGEGDLWRGEFETSILGTREIIDVAVKELFDDSPNRSIVIVNSVAAWAVIQDQPLSYHVAKAALLQMARYYAVVLGPKGIRVNTVSPGSLMKEESADYFSKNPKLQELYQKTIPLGRMGTHADLTHAIEYLCSPKAAFLTGQNIVLDGGLSLRWQESVVRQWVLS